jgi:exoribonuclease II
MPLTPIQAAKSSSSAESKIVPGRVVEYEQHAKAQLGVTLAEKRGKWVILNQQGSELELPADRLTLIPGSSIDQSLDKHRKAAALGGLAQQAFDLSETISLEDAWQIFLGETKEVSVQEVAELLFAQTTGKHYLAARRALLADQVYFKRKKIGFEPRPESVVEELKIKVRAEEEKQKQREALIDAVLKRLNDHTAPLPASIASLEELAALGSSAAEAKATKELLELIDERGKLGLQGKPEDKAFQLLVAMKHFSPDQDLAPIRLGRPVRFDEETLKEARAVAAADFLASCSDSASGSAVHADLRGLACITIDGAETKDFDDALSVEQTASGLRFGIHISDVAGAIRPESLLEKAALRRGTSIYTPDAQIPMLPPLVSENTLSLIEGTERLAMSFFLDVEAAGSIINRSVSRSIIRLARRFTYEEADAILCDNSASSAEYSDMLHKLWQMSSNSEARRMAAGAIQFDRREMCARLLPDGTIELEPANEDTPARRLVSEMMILANESAALFAKENKLPIVFRAQEAPDTDVNRQGLDLPEGPAREYFLRGLLKKSTVSYEPQPHSGLGLEAYTQVTSPIRRAVDLITQRQLGKFLDSGALFYPPQKISELIGQIEAGVDEAVQIQRERNRYWLLKYLLQNNIREIDAVIVRVDGTKPIAEIDVLFGLFPFHPNTEKGQYVPNNRKNLGKKIKLRVEHINPRTQTLTLREIA